MKHKRQETGQESEKVQPLQENVGGSGRKKGGSGFLKGLGLGVVGGLVLGYFLFQSSVKVAVEFEPIGSSSSITAEVRPTESGGPMTREEMVKKFELVVQEDDAQPLYQSTCLIEVKPTNTNHPVPVTRRFIHTQFAIITAPTTLNLAVDAIHLESRWKKDRKEVLKTLRKIVTAKQRRGTNLIEISVVHQDKEDAQMICKAVYQAYAQRRRELEIGMRKEQLKAIKVELQSKSDRVAELRQRLMDIAEKSGLVYVDGRTEGLVDMAEKELRQAEGDKNSLLREIELQKKGSLARQSLEHKLQLVEARVKKMREVIASEKGSGEMMARDIQEFNIARKEYQTAVAIKEAMEVLYDREKTKMVMPVTNVIVHEEPTIQEVRSK